MFKWLRYKLFPLINFKTYEQMMEEFRRESSLIIASSPNDSYKTQKAVHEGIHVLFGKEKYLKVGQKWEDEE